METALPWTLIDSYAFSLIISDVSRFAEAIIFTSDVNNGALFFVVFTSGITLRGSTRKLFVFITTYALAIELIEIGSNRAAFRS